MHTCFLRYLKLKIVNLRPYGRFDTPILTQKKLTQKKDEKRSRSVIKKITLKIFLFLDKKTTILLPNYEVFCWKKTMKYFALNKRSPQKLKNKFLRQKWCSKQGLRSSRCRRFLAGGQEWTESADLSSFCNAKFKIQLVV